MALESNAPVPFNIFISYAWDDTKTYVRDFVDYLQLPKFHEFFKVWIDVEELYDSVNEIIAKAIKEADLFICFCSQYYQTRPVCRQEAEMASRKGKKMLFINMTKGNTVQGEKSYLFSNEDWFEVILGNRLWFPFFKNYSIKRKNETYDEIIEKHIARLLDITPLKDFPTTVADELVQGTVKNDIEQISSILSRYKPNKIANRAMWEQKLVFYRHCNVGTPLHEAARKDHIEAFRLLWPVFSNLVDVQDQYKQTAVNVAVLNGSVNVVEFVLKEFLYVHKIREGEFGRSLIHQAAEVGNSELVKMLIKGDADLSAKSNKYDGKQQALHLAAEYGHKDVVGILLEADYMLMYAENMAGNLPCHKAALKGHVPVIELFLKKDQDIDVKNGKTGRTMLHYATIGGHIETVEYLIERNANMFSRGNPQKDFGWLPIHWACESDEEEIVKRFVEKDSRLLWERTSNNETPLDVANEFSATRVACYLNSKMKEHGPPQTTECPTVQTSATYDDDFED